MSHRMALLTATELSPDKPSIPWAFYTDHFAVGMWNLYITTHFSPTFYPHTLQAYKNGKLILPAGWSLTVPALFLGIPRASLSMVIY